MKIRAVCSPAILLLVGACSSTPVYDLALEEQIYRDVAYATKLPGDRSVFLTPVADTRRPDVLPASQGPYPIAYDNERPVPEMVDEILRRELLHSQLFTGIRAHAREADLVIKPSLVTFSLGVMEMMQGARALAEVGLRLEIYGPSAPNGARTLLLDEVYGDRIVTEASLVPANRTALIGVTLRNAMLRLLHGLDSANVGRDGVPLAEPDGTGSDR
jgi:hypothetical protein